MQSTIKMVVNEGKKESLCEDFGVTDTQVVYMKVLGAPVAAHPVFFVIISASLA